VKRFRLQLGVALYHNVEHTMLVTLVGHDIRKGRALLIPTPPSDYAHLIVACLMHDIGYVRGILKGDGPAEYVIDAAGHKAKLPRGSSDAALLLYHVDRSKLFVMDRIATSDVFDATRIARAIDFTRFPIPAEADDQESEEGSLLRAADLALVSAMVTDEIEHFLVSRSRNFAEEMKDTNYDPRHVPVVRPGAPQVASCRAATLDATDSGRARGPRPVVAAEGAMPARSGSALAQHRT
jgi:hypothetical protein